MRYRQRPSASLGYRDHSTSPRNNQPYVRWPTPCLGRQDIELISPLNDRFTLVMIIVRSATSHSQRQATEMVWRPTSGSSRYNVMSTPFPAADLLRCCLPKSTTQDCNQGGGAMAAVLLNGLKRHPETQALSSGC